MKEIVAWKHGELSRDGESFGMVVTALTKDVKKRCRLEESCPITSETETVDGGTYGLDVAMDMAVIECSNRFCPRPNACQVIGVTAMITMGGLDGPRPVLGDC